MWERVHQLGKWRPEAYRFGLRLVDFTLTPVAAGNMERCQQHHHHPNSPIPGHEGGCEDSVTFGQEVRSTCLEASCLPFLLQPALLSSLFSPSKSVTYHRPEILIYFPLGDLQFNS